MVILKGNPTSSSLTLTADCSGLQRD